MPKPTLLTQSFAVGLPAKRGYPVTKRNQAKKPVFKSKRRELVQSTIREVAGYAPYEKRILEFLKNDLEKRALRIAKKRLGNHKRAKAKRDELNDVVRRARSK
eukprot:TRINITY_DN27564_c0_g1_i2.p1 TRINITY_DN27564_c0_g1~~TRINITY_DN27564_c0_g1_i2.p1  ORF type:complete len:103 (-),score=16.05 TRINITY_DN27564_c0_g1_i2:45-353(-)